MDKKEEFDLEFDFEKEFGLKSEDLQEGNAVNAAADEDFSAFDFENMPKTSDDELDELLSDEFLASIGIIREAPAEEAPAAEEAVEEFIEAPAEETVEEPVEAEPPVQEPPEIKFTQDDFLSEDYIAEAAADAGEEEPVLELNFDELLAAESPMEEAEAFAPSAEPAFEVEPELGAEFTEAFEKDFPSDDSDNAASTAAAAEADPPAKQHLPQNPRRRRKLSKERIIKEVYLPPIIAVLSLILIITFIAGAINRGVQANKDQQEALDASNAASAGALQSEADTLISEAKALAAVYDYDAAIAKLDSFSGEMSKYPSIMDLYNTYTQARDKLVPYQDFASIPNLSFHGLIADPSRAFIDETFGKSYIQNYVTTEEFSKILEQLYANNFILVDFDSFIVETTGADGTVSYATQPMYLPEGKKPLMLTQTLVNYELFTVDSDGDLEADKGGDGFASKLVIDENGQIVNEMVDSDGNIVYGAYDLVPILNAFLKEHPDFSYRGARAILAVTGEDGVFGYRIMHSVKEKKGEDYYNQQVEGAKKIAKALRDEGYTIGCYTYSNVSYGEYSATKIQGDLDAWNKEVVPVLGEINLMVYAKSSDIAANGSYAGNNKYNVLKNEGFRYFISSANVPWAEVTNEYVRQSRIMVTGGVMMNTPSTYANYFDVASVLSELRGK